MNEAESFWCNIRDTHRFSRKKLHELVLPRPGFVGVGDDYYTGWLYLSRSGIIYSIYHNVSGLPPLPQDIVKDIHSPYFRLEKQQADVWLDRIQNSPLSLAQLLNLGRLPNETSHPFYIRMSKLGINYFKAENEKYIGEYWQELKVRLDSKDPSIAEYIQSHILNIAILERAGKRLLKNAGYWNSK